MPALDIVPLFNRALEALRDGREIATTMQVLGGYDGIARVVVVGDTLEARQNQAYATGRIYGVATRAVILITLIELERTSQLALAGHYGESTPALIVACMERDRRPRCLAHPYVVEDGRRVVDDTQAPYVTLTTPAEPTALLGRFWDGVEATEAATKRDAAARRRR